MRLWPSDGHRWRTEGSARRQGVLRVDGPGTAPIQLTAKSGRPVSSPPQRQPFFLRTVEWSRCAGRVVHSHTIDGKDRSDVVFYSAEV